MGRTVLETDVLVVGLGPGGGSAAWQAARGGARVLAVERNRRVGEPVQCAEFIPNPMGAYAQPEGVRVQPITGMKSVLPSGSAVDTDFPGIMIDRARFDRAIADRAAEAGAELWTGARLVGLDASARLATIRHKERGRDLQVHYRCLVAADGPHSPVAAAMGLAALELVYTRQYTCRLKAPYAATDVWLSDEFPGGYGWLFPKGDVANVGMGADKRFEDNLKGPLERLHGQLVSDAVVDEAVLYRTGGAIPVGGLRERLAVDSTLFVGDAAGLTHPITGAGISAAVVSGERAGQAAAAWLGGDAEAFEDFEEDVRDQYEVTLARAVERRAFLLGHWRTPRANEDRIQRRGWIAFDEYFAP
ncbi:MAG TPA: NAD(P)/FAD-dependent oxidoreductase [Gammaproteobacteria bacterium]|nr:NAD(P)/FAD-dependent oxidoreductase [Gammaproteobacteria bacterium]